MIANSLLQEKFASIVPFRLDETDTIALDLSVNNTALDQINLWDTQTFDYWLKNFLQKNNKKAAIGGYLENRRIYRRSKHFEGRSIHLGIDIWAKAGTPVFAPTDAKVHSFQNNTAWGDYGPTIILEHCVAGSIFYTLYGHLSLHSLKGLYEGKELTRGSQFAEFGNFPENGDWSPHLHFQIITDLLGKKGDFYGVCSPQEQEKFAQICPNPNLILKSPLLAIG